MIGKVYLMTDEGSAAPPRGGFQPVPLIFNIWVYIMGFHKLSFYSNIDTVEEPSLFTPWSLVHLLSGAIIYLYTRYFFKNISRKNAMIIMLFLHTLYEIKDLQYYFFGKKGDDYDENNSLPNSICDTICSALGLLIAYNITKTVNLTQLSICTIVLVLIHTIFRKHGLG